MTNPEIPWQPIDTAPHDRKIIVFAPAAHGLPDLITECQYHPDAGFCVCELREPIYWREIVK
jgi:hypothetical protein